MSVLQKESTPFPRKRQPSAEGGEDVNHIRRHQQLFSTQPPPFDNSSTLSRVDGVTLFRVVRCMWTKCSLRLSVMDFCALKKLT